MKTSRLQELSSTFYGEMRNANAALKALKRKAKAVSKEKDQSEADEEQSDEATEAEEVTEEADEFEKTQSLEILKTAKLQYAKAIEATYKVMHNLLAGDPQNQWDRIIKEMHESDSWAGPDGKEHQGS